ncbi:MAG: CDP-diacylglycerol--glycerol-3-phosphate 3-phosphatidyltransferase [bacterium]
MSAVPNILTILRIILIPFYINFFLIEKYIIAAVLFLVSAMTDFFDGYIARKYNITTKLGRILDPAADKLTIISILLVLIFKNIIPDFIAIIILTREIFIFISSTISFLLGYDFINPSNLGKISIFLLYVAITLKLFNVKFIDMALFYIVIPLNIISGIDYVLTNIKLLSSKMK